MTNIDMKQRFSKWVADAECISGMELNELETATVKGAFYAGGGIVLEIICTLLNELPRKEAGEKIHQLAMGMLEAVIEMQKKASDG